MNRNKRKPKYSLLQRRDMKYAYGMLAPAVILLSVFVVIPLIMAFYYSLQDWNFYTDPKYIGLENYRVAWESDDFRKAIWNAVRFVVLIVPLSIMLNFGFALMLKSLAERAPRFVKASKVITYLPGLASGIVTGIIFSYVFSYHSGMVNQVLMNLGFDRIAFTTTSFWATFIIVVPTLWLGLGGGMILNYAALMTIPDEIYEAASMDGATGLTKLIYITLPQMKNIFILQVINGVAGTLQIFDLPYMMTGGGPLGETTTPVMYIYLNYRNPGRKIGFTLAASILMMVVIAALNAVVFKVIKSEKMVEG